MCHFYISVNSSPVCSSNVIQFELSNIQNREDGERDEEDPKDYQHVKTPLYIICAITTNNASCHSADSSIAFATTHFWPH